MFVTEIIDIQGVPTKVRTWGNSLTDIPADNSNYIIFIPGNPGVIDFYIEFLGEIYKSTNQTVWSVGHAGHDDLKAQRMPSSAGNEYLFNLEGQIKHKVTFINEHVPKNVNITFIGHSMGTYIILQLLKLKTINEKVLKSYLLFPTIEKIADTVYGKFVINRITPLKFPIISCAKFFQILPEFAQDFVVRFFLKIYSVPDHYSEVFKYLTSPYILENWGTVGADAAQKINERDDEVLRGNIDKIKMYYGADDLWTPITYYENLKKDIPDIDAELCSKGYEHSFVLRHSIPVAKMVVEWMKNS